MVSSSRKIASVASLLSSVQLDEGVVVSPPVPTTREDNAAVSEVGTNCLFERIGEQIARMRGAFCANAPSNQPARRFRPSLRKNWRASSVAAGAGIPPLPLSHTGAGGPSSRLIAPESSTDLQEHLLWVYSLISQAGGPSTQPIAPEPPADLQERLMWTYSIICRFLEYANKNQPRVANAEAVPMLKYFQRTLCCTIECLEQLIAESDQNATQQSERQASEVATTGAKAQPVFVWKKTTP